MGGDDQPGPPVRGGRVADFEGTLIRLQVDQLPGDRSPKPLWLWCSRTGATPDEVDRRWQAFLRRFDLEHTFRLFKQVLGWTAPIEPISTSHTRQDRMSVAGRGHFRPGQVCVASGLLTDHDREGQVSSDAELAYLAQGKLGRLATIDAGGRPHVVPLGWRYNPALDTIDIGGRDFARTRKFRNAQRNPDVALVIDDVLPPWRPRCVMIRGTAEALPDATGPDGQPAGPVIRLHPAEVISWGMDFAAE